MSLYLVAKEDQDGLWMGDPETFDTSCDALDWARTRMKHNPLPDGQMFVLYECGEGETVKAQ